MNCDSVLMKKYKSCHKNLPLILLLFWYIYTYIILIGIYIITIYIYFWLKKDSMKGWGKTCWDFQKKNVTRFPLDRRSMSWPHGQCRTLLFLFIKIICSQLETSFPNPLRNENTENPFLPCIDIIFIISLLPCIQTAFLQGWI